MAVADRAAFAGLVRRVLAQARQIASQPDATNELSYRPALYEFLKGLPDAMGMPDLSSVPLTEPKRKEYGTPDFKVKKKNGWLIGYVEAKGIQADLKAYERSEQIQRYRESGQRILLTNLLEFALIDLDRSEGAPRAAFVTVDRVRLISTTAFLKGQEPHPGEVDALRRLLVQFLSEALPDIHTPRELAIRLAVVTRQAADLLLHSLAEEPATGSLHSLKLAFEESLLPALSDGQFVDMYAQTITYGLFSAAWHHQSTVGVGTPFDLDLAWRDIPRTNPFLRRLFESITGSELEGKSYRWVIEDLVDVLAALDLNEILADFGRRRKGQDPVVHFYEDFLAAYNPRLRELRGVYYTPEPVVSYIVRSIDYLVKTRFHLPDGLADTSVVESTTDGQKPLPTVLVLDPATGTGTFLYQVIELIRDQFRDDSGNWSDYVREYLLPRLFGFELLVAPYAVAHLKLGAQLAARDLDEPLRSRMRFDFRSDERLNVFLTNTLDEAITCSEHLPGIAGVISGEANAAADAKRDLPIMVVLGNPPYSSSMSTGPWIMGLLETYKQGLDEKKVDLNREEWKFLRFAHWRIERTGSGIIGFVINNTFLDAVTHRRMRESLLESFGEVFVLDLHGSVKSRSSRLHDGDMNVFDITQGVTVVLFVRTHQDARPGVVHHWELWGSRDFKYSWLEAHDVSTTEWQEIRPTAPAFDLAPRESTLDETYEAALPMNHAFRQYSSGIQTKKDRLTIHFTEQMAWDTVTRIVGLPVEEVREQYGLGEDGTDWKVSLALADLRSSGPDRSRVKPMLYRPFDVRYTYYTGRTKGFHGRPRRDIMQHMLAGPNLGLIAMRQTVDEAFTHVGVTRLINCHGTFYLGNKGQDYLFPLYLYDAGAPGDQQNQLGLTFKPAGGREPNLSAELIAMVQEETGLQFIPDGRGDLTNTVGPDDVLHYIYAVLHSPTYRGRYANRLRSDFPHIPITGDAAMFVALAQKGADLVGIHLFEDNYPSASWMGIGPAASPVRQDPALFPIPGDNVVVDVVYVSAAVPTDRGKTTSEGRVYISSDRVGREGQYFTGVPRNVWDFQVGGYQVCEKWLKDRKGHALSLDDRRHYARIVAALRETIALMSEIDELVPDWSIEMAGHS